MYLPEEVANAVEKVYNSANDPLADEYVKILNEWVKKVRVNWKDNVEQLDEELTVYRATLISITKQYKTALEANLDNNYAVWEEVNKQIPSIREKTQVVLDTLKPVELELKTICGYIDKLNEWKLSKFLDTLANIRSCLDGETGTMIKFLFEKFEVKK